MKKTNNKYYAGIGSRETPKDIQVFFQQLAAWLARHGYVLRSGAAQGADKAFEIGCDRVSGKKEIFLPWKGFEGSTSPYYEDNPKAIEIAANFHPAWDKLSQGAKKLQARNTHQVLGLNLDSPSEFIICWTKGGKGQGGTGQALRIAKAYNIPVFDAGKHVDMDEMKIACKKFLRDFIKEET